MTSPYSHSAARWGEGVWPVGVPPLAPSAPPPPVPPHTPSGGVPRIPRWDVPDARQPTVIERLRARFPGIHFWWGVFTFSWWAYVPGPGLGRLIEASTPDELGDRLARLRAQSGL